AVHVFAGGSSDNLALSSIKRVRHSDRARATSEYERIVVVFVDAFRRSLGVSPSSADPRGLLSYAIDTNFLDATGSLREANRQRILEDFFARTIAAYERVADCRRDNLPDHACAATWPRSVRSEVEAQLQKKLFFFHVAFDAVIDQKAIEAGVASLFGAPRGAADACVRPTGVRPGRP